MRVLLYSTVLYLFGIAAVLYVRPASMFRHDGRWKEFGVNSVETTYFPFWMFCIIWAVVAHGLVRLFCSDDAGHVMPHRYREEVTPIAPIPVPEPEPELASGASGAAPPDAAPGYYKLDVALMKKKGVPKYIYIGTEKPAEMYE